MEKLSGSLENVVFHNEENGYTVADLDVDGEMVTVVGHMVTVELGTHLTLLGKWTNHLVYGRQFQFEHYRVELPTTEDGLIQYLSSGLLPGIGPKTAAQIVERFGQETLKILDDDPSRLLEIPGIGKKTLSRMLGAYQDQRDIRKVLIELQEYGVSSKMAMKLYNAYHDQTVAILLEDPYRIVRDIRGVGFKAADQLAEKLGVDRDNSKRIQAGVVQALRECYAQGNTYMNEEELTARAQELLGVDRETVEMGIRDTIISGAAHMDEIDGRRIYYPMGLYEAEDATALMMTQLAGSHFEADDIDVEEAIDRYESHIAITLDEEQRNAIKTAVEQGLVIITGGPGTGKTTIINGILNILQSMRLSVQLAAPTGRAAKRMTETTGEEAKTLHRLLEYHYDDNVLTPTFERNADNPLELNALIVDEASMIDIVLMKSLLEAIEEGTRLILVGDADQLPSVGPGNVLSDLIESGIAPVVRLKRIYRQSEKSQISVNAKAINEGSVPRIDNQSDFVLIPEKNQEGIEKTVLDLLGYRLKDNAGIDVVHDVQVISPVKKGLVGTIALNQKIQAILNPASSRKNEHTFGPVVFREGDKVMQIRNNYQMKWRDALTFEEGDGVYNGDIGTVKSISDDKRQLTVAFTDGREAVYGFDQLDELAHAFAMTVHKSQGSEFPVVIMPLIGGSPLFLNRKLLYTGVTRAKQMMILVGRPEHFIRMIQSDDSRKRKTGLVFRIARYRNLSL